MIENTTLVLGGGQLPTLNASQWHTLGLSFGRGQTVTANLDGEHLGAFKVGARAGMVGLAAGWNEAQFDAFTTWPKSPEIDM